MAEAVMEECPPAPQRFFCHMCNIEIDNVSPEYTCPHCTGGFIEELPASEPPSADIEINEDPGFFVGELNSRLTDEISSLLMSVTGTNLAERDGSGVAGGGGIGGHVGTGDNHTRNGPHHSHAMDDDRRFVHTIQTFDHVLQDFLVSITAGGAGGNVGASPMFFVGNPADYVYGRDGLDTIVTQLLNQMESTGPPPLAKDKIDEIPVVPVTAEQIKSKLQCSICWEDFVLDETVRQLPCVHIYHENCIIPWLELHATCPVCRQTLSGDNPDEQRQAAVVDVTNSLRNVAALYRSDSDASGNNSVDSNRSPIGRRQTRSATRQNNQSSQQNDRMRDDDGNIDYEFD